LRKLLLYPYSYFWKSLFWLTLTGTYISAVLPQDIAPTIGALSDKWIHFLAFAVLTVLFRFAYCTTMVRTIVSLSFYGIFIEVSQYFIPNRCAEILDVVSDMIGVAIGAVFSTSLQRRYNENSE